MEFSAMQCFLGGSVAAGYSILQILTRFSFHLLTTVHSNFLLQVSFSPAGKL